MGLKIYSLAVTTTNSSQTLSPSAVKVLLKNDGSTACYFNLNGAATTSHFELDADDEILIGLNTVSTVQAITASGTTTLTIIATEEY